VAGTEGGIGTRLQTKKTGRNPRRTSWLILAAAFLLSIGLWLGIRVAAPPADGRHAGGLRRQAVPEAQLHPARVDYRRLDARIRELMAEPGMVGLAVGTIERGRVRFLRGYGETRAGSGAPVTPDTVFRWASLSKGVASTLAVKLAEQGKLSLDERVTAMGTSLTLPGGGQTVTVADLLAHRVGLVRNAWDDRLEDDEDPRVIRSQLGTLPTYCPPGTCYQYQNIAYDAVSEIVERRAGQPYGAAARALLFRPLGMAHASVGRAGLEGAASWAAPHHGTTPVAVKDAYYRVPAAGGVNSSIRDLTRWMLAQSGAAPRVLSPAALDILHRPRIDTPPHGPRGPMDRALADAAYGLGWRSFTYAGHRLVGHRGAVDGYGSLILFDPAQRSGIVMLWNSNRYTAARLQLEFFDLLYGLPPTDWLALRKRTGGAAE
jgi:beta-lactamase class C